ncbi:hypothetical protein ISS30_01155 [bacterium]|nr:hypothetical protein [FCB group bacterium]MBL7190278.1 hypothetical protein [bacterium]
MDNILSIDKIELFLLFFVPGFISIKIWTLIVPSEKLDFSKSFFEVIAYSALNFAGLSWLIFLIHTNGFPVYHTFWYLVLVFFIIFVMPTIWPIIFFKAFQCKFVSKFIISPYQKPWDFVFSKRKIYWIIIHLKDGRNIGGKYGANSFASSAPAEEQIYLEKVWEIDSQGKFGEPIDRSGGIIIMREEISSVEFFIN